MGKQYQGNRGGSSGGFRGGSGGRGGGGMRGGRGGSGGRGGFRPQQDFGPPAYVIPYGTFVHRSESTFVVKCTDLARFPKFNRGIYLQNKSKVGNVDEIFGPVNGFYFSVKPAEGISPDSFKAGQTLYINPEDLLQVDRLTKPQARGKSSGGRGGSSFGGRGGARGGRGGSFSGGRGGSFGGAPRGGSFGGRGGGSFRGGSQGGFRR